MNSLDCDESNILDSCDAGIDGDKADINDNGLPDSCELAQGDLNLDGCIDGAGLGLLFGNWGVCPWPIQTRPCRPSQSISSIQSKP